MDRQLRWRCEGFGVWNYEKTRVEIGRAERGRILSFFKIYYFVECFKLLIILFIIFHNLKKNYNNVECLKKKKVIVTLF